MGALDGHVVRLFDHHLQQIAIHSQREPGRFTTDAEHITPEKRSGIERGAVWWLTKAHNIGVHAGGWADNILQQRGVHGVRVLMGLVSLTQRHPSRTIDRACQVAQSHGAYQSRAAGAVGAWLWGGPRAILTSLGALTLPTVAIHLTRGLSHPV